MSVEIRELPNESIIILKIVPPPKTPEDVETVAQQVVAFKRKRGGHVYRILDFSLFKGNFTFADLIHGMAAEMKVEGGINDVDVSSIYVGSDDWVVFGVDAFREQSQYGQTNVIQICATVDDAIACARADNESKQP